MVQCLLKAWPSSWVGGFAQGLSGCVLWVSRDGPALLSLTHPQHHAQTVLTSRPLSSSLLALQEMLSCLVLVLPRHWPSAQLCPCPWCWQSIAGLQHGAHLACRTVPAVPWSLVTSSQQWLCRWNCRVRSMGAAALKPGQANEGLGFVISGIMGIS